MATLCESWDSNWMDGSCAAGFDDYGHDVLDGHLEADVFEAALEPLPTWDGAAYSIGGGNTEAMDPFAVVGRNRRSVGVVYRRWWLLTPLWIPTADHLLTTTYI